ncbi:hypothetical protein Taro_013646 [Colocasia esculenta]|uniref:Uncharacterized protein n=1 Tax=Colocasia esculenta TaxID=4460 RepID=A0A843UGR8_COLES|nr:hypothetical protein [Colocasia esculenta]
MSLHLVGVVWRCSWWLGCRRSPTPSRSSSPSRLLRPAQTVHLKPIKASCVNIRQFWTAIQEHVFSPSDSAADPVNVMAR